jgi:hypothetical protein
VSCGSDHHTIILPEPYSDQDFHFASHPRNLDEDAQAQERAQLLSGQLEQTRLDVPFASEKDKKVVQIDYEEGKFVGGGNLGFLRQIYFGRLVSSWLYGFLLSSQLDMG